MCAHRLKRKHVSRFYTRKPGLTWFQIQTPTRILYECNSALRLFTFIWWELAGHNGPISQGYEGGYARVGGGGVDPKNVFREGLWVTSLDPKTFFYLFIFILLLACQKGWWCIMDTPTPCLKYWPYNFEEGKKLFQAWRGIDHGMHAMLNPPPPPPPEKKNPSYATGYVIVSLGWL